LSERDNLEPFDLKEFLKHNCLGKVIYAKAPGNVRDSLILLGALRLSNEIGINPIIATSEIMVTTSNTFHDDDFPFVPLETVSKSLICSVLFDFV
jgi:hypothetical protein